MVTNIDNFLKEIMIIKNTLFKNVNIVPLKNQIFTSLDFRSINPKNGVGIKIKEVSNTFDRKTLVFRFNKNGRVFLCKHPDTTESVYVINGSIKNTITEKNIKEHETFTINDNEPHELISDNGCELLVTLKFKK